MSDLTKQLYGGATPLGKRDEMARMFAEWGYDSHTQRAHTPNLMAQGMRQRTNQWDPKPDPHMKAFVAGAADPFQLPSAATGLVSPEIRDTWRAAQDESPVAAAAGSISSSGAGGFLLKGAKAGVSAAATAAYPYLGDISDWASSKLHPNYKPKKLPGVDDE